MLPYFWTPEEEELLKQLIEKYPGRRIPVIQAFQEKYPRSKDSINKQIERLARPERAPIYKEEPYKVLPPFPFPLPKIEPQERRKHTVLVISDLHAPFQHPYALDFLRDTYRDQKCDRVVCIGDEIDFHRISRHPSERDSMGAKDELTCALTFMRELFKVFPTVETCISNHTSRPYRMAYTVGILDEFLRGYSEWMQAPAGWSWHEEIRIDGVRYIHGEPYTGEKGPLNAVQDSGLSTVMGHIHAYAGVWQTPSLGNLFGMNVGCLIDLKAYAFRYGKAYRSTPVIGCGVVREGKWPEFIPLA